MSMYKVFSYKGTTYEGYEGQDALLLEVMIDLATAYAGIVGTVNAIYHEDTCFALIEGTNKYVNIYNPKEGVYTFEEIEEIYSDFFSNIWDVIDFSEVADIDTIKVIEY